MAGVDKPVFQEESPLEANRRINNVVRIGTVEEVRVAKPARCRVRLGDLLTDWLPWLTLRAGGPAKGSLWWPPVKGEQVIVLAPGGDLAQAVALPAAYSDHMEQPSETADIMHMRWSNDAYMEYQPRPSRLRIQVGSSYIDIMPEHIILHAAGGSLLIDEDGATGSPEVWAGGIKLSKHRHGGVQQGGSKTALPVQDNE